MNTHALPASRAGALARLAQVRPEAYARTRNHLEGAVTGLSPYLTHGLITLPDVLGELLARHPLEVNHKLVFELGWREFFRNVWSHTGDGILQSLHAGPLPEACYARELPEDIRQGRTGVAVIDEAVRTLYATRYLHNHARMWLASYVVHMRHVHWRAGADWLAAHLLDGDLGSNHLSWQWVAGTGSHKPYLFNADNVARFAPPAWHSGGTVLDQSYEALDRIARTPGAGPGSQVEQASSTRSEASGITEPALLAEPPADLPLQTPEAQMLASLQGREVWLVHPWALRAPPANLDANAVQLGVYLREYHAAWPWPAARWRWVDGAMAAVTPHRWFTDLTGLRRALAGASAVRSVADPHITPWLVPLAQLDPAPTLFPPSAQHCHSFSQWWTRTTRGLRDARDLL